MNINELEFKPHPAGMGGTRAVIYFDNGYGASVITGSYFYTSEDAPYEVAVMKGDIKSGSLTYDTPITDDVIDHQTEEEVENLLDNIAALPKVEG